MGLPIEGTNTTAAANEATIAANLATRQTALQAWITANPTGAVLTAAQTLFLAELVNGISLILLEEFGSTSDT